MHGAGRNVYKILMEKPERKKSKQRWEDNIIMDLLDIRVGDGNWINLAQNRDQWQDFVNMLVNSFSFHKMFASS
jgi:hypothetical protein